jgi:hypothetical protein
MDLIPGKRPNTTSELIAMAVSLVGESEFVRETMNSSPEDFQDYCAGQQEPSLSEFDRLVNLIIAEQAKIIVKNREFIAKIRAKQQP